MTVTPRGPDAPAGDLAAAGRAPRRGAHGGRGGERAMVPEAQPRSYYGQPILKPPVWSPEVGWYLFAGGLGGASLTLAAVARATGRPGMARRALLTGVAALAVSPPLLIRDLGRPARFHHMLRVIKPSSPMSMGTWLLTATGTLAGGAAACEVLGVLPRTRTALEAAAAVLGTGVATYTAVLVADTSVPIWQAARTELPFVFAAGAATSAGAAALALSPAGESAPARRLAVGGAVAELVATRVMGRRLGEVGEPYHGEGRPGRLARTAEALIASGAALAVVGGRRRAPAVLAAAALLAGAACQRFAVLTAGTPSATDPHVTVGPQRRRIAAATGVPSRGWSSSP